MGFIPLPLGVVMVRVLGHALQIEGPAAFLLLVTAYLCLASFRILNSVVILGKACDLISQHQNDKVVQSSTVSRATSPINGRLHVVRQLASDFSSSPQRNLHRSVTIDATPLPVSPPPPDIQPTERNLGPAAIFSNSAVSINSVCLNEELLCKESAIELPSIAENETLTRSVPNIQANLENEAKDLFAQELLNISASEEFSKKRAESEPSIPHLVDTERTSVT